MSQIVISGFAPTDKVPGAYGEVLFGTGAISVGSIPLVLLLVGLKTAAGNAAPDTQVRSVFSETDARRFFGGGSQLARMASSALRVSGVTIRAIAVAEAPGAVAATVRIAIAGTWNTSWNIGYRIGGKLYASIVGSTDTPAQAAQNIAAVFNGDPDCPATAAAAPDGSVTLSVKCKGAWGNRFLAFDASEPPSGATSTITGGAAATGGGVFFGGGTGVEDVSNVLSTIHPQTYDRIAVGQIDATNIGRWRAQVNAQADVLVGILQHAIVASNDTLTAAVSIAQNTLNSERFQVCWFQNSETHPSEIAAAMAALRTQREQSDPDASYDNAVLAGVAPQSQVADIPQHGTLVSALNNGITPITTTSDGFAVVVRSIVSHSLRGSIPDYSTLDTGDAVVPDYILKDLKLVWSTQVAPANPRIAPDVGPQERRRPSGVLTPSVWNGIVYTRLKRFEAGTDLPAPILINVDGNLPVSTFDTTALRIMTAVRVIAAPANHQIGISVRPTSLAAA
ncbi:hypothetical protein LZC95_08035 [Pendulispora brunnea]|uniref:Uncharacterized protein n=1 Tax=Pendulispora brunnea TaxID=2905690 RepID=A0ABZ2KFE2_9BACT